MLVNFSVGSGLVLLHQHLLFQRLSMFCIQRLVSVVLDSADIVIVDLALLDAGLDSLLLNIVEPLVAIVDIAQLLFRTSLDLS